jgi:NAD(P)-dependent dehydrogenase (short-subunit alcohol dehydrogenase family)
MTAAETRVALVTGATAGLGRSIALRLGADGLFVHVVGRDPERGANVVAEIEQSGGQARFHSANLSDVSTIGPLVRETGPVDVLINNAGFSVWGATEEMRAEQFDAMFAANVRAPYFLVAAFAPAMAEGGEGVIINIGSMAGSVGLPTGAAYGATKAALAALTRGWTAEYSPRGVRVNTVAPGPVYTRPEARALFDDLGSTTALHRAAQPGEIADLVGFLASPQAAYITGATLAADGGRTAI